MFEEVVSSQPIYLKRLLLAQGRFYANNILGRLSILVYGKW